jgi:hypothetical protein
MTVRADRPLPAHARFELYATDGRTVMVSTGSGQTPMDVSKMVPGVYHWRVLDGDGPLGRGSIVIGR